MASLYERVGGDKAVNAAVELFYRNVLADGCIARFFESVDIDKQITK
jgi:hemoglobin